MFSNTNQFTIREIEWRDSFWKNKIPKNPLSPNFLTIIRMVGAIFLFIYPLSKTSFLLVVIFLFLTDYFDGIIARTQNKITLFGTWADPIADRLLTLSVVYFLYSINPGFWKDLFLLMLIPELLILLVGLILVFAKKSLTPKPNVWGRIKFTLYFLGIILFLLGVPLFSEYVIIIGILFGFIATIGYISRIFQ